MVLVHEITSLAALEDLWRQELAHDRITVASDEALESGRHVTVRLEMPGPCLWLSGTVRHVRSTGGRFAVELDLALRGVQAETLRRLADS